MYKCMFYLIIFSEKNKNLLTVNFQKNWEIKIKSCLEKLSFFDLDNGIFG